ncbi:hypothetical protein HII13_001137 [Brettanomyces bruxellensis]|nr:hypothetical protein HII13_001137 [Brettanomyces bruxellensis]
MHVLDLLGGLSGLTGTIGEFYSSHIPLSVGKHPKDNHLPVVVWHGMGDYYNSESISSVNETLHKYIPNLEFYSIRVKEDSRQDQEAGIVGDCMSPDTATAKEICDLPIHNLITFGSPHNGFDDLPRCDNWLCKRRNELLKGHLYDPRVQNSMVQAQYYRDVHNFDDYITGSNFLKFVNNEFIKNNEYADNLIKLNRLVLVMFLKDHTLVPKESAWYFDTDPETNQPIPFNLTMAYKQNLVGLKTLDMENKLDFITIDGEHMQLTEEDLRKIALSYL